MNTQEAYNRWASVYDNNENKTRDLEARVLSATLSGLSFKTCLEVGCGTGKNTEWLLQKATHITAVDLSAEMLKKAKEKIGSDKVEFLQVDINADWNFTKNTFDLISFSLVLEHIENLDHIFKEAFKKLNEGGHIYIGELHPFKQYTGSKARFETKEGLQVVPCYNHHLSDFIRTAKKYGFRIINLDECFDNDDHTTIPRILVVLLQKNLSSGNS